jgi:hypothetical protein
VGNINVDQIKFSKIFPVTGYVDASLVRITQTNINGYGKIAQLKVILKDTVTANWLYFTTSNAMNTNNAGINNPLNSGRDSVPVVMGVGVKQFAGNINHIVVFPNPSAGSFAVNCSKNIDEIKITDILGNIIYSAKPNTQKINLQIEEAGVYFVTITNGKESTVRKVIVNK